MKCHARHAAPPGGGLLCESIEKSFGTVKALREVHLWAPRGEITALVGPNGAGKSTLLRCVVGLTRPDAGSITWDDAPLREAVQRSFSFMPEERGLYPQDTVRQTVEFYARLRRPRARRNDFLGEVISSLGLDSLVGRRVGELSLGNQQRVQIAAALVCSQHCILWDEPFSGLDVEGVDALSDLLRSRKEDGIAVILSSHQLDVLERLCDRVTVIHAGRVESTTLGAHEGTREWEVTMPDGSVETMPDTHGVRARLAHSMSWGGIFSLSQKNRTRMREFYDVCSRRAREEE